MVHDNTRRNNNGLKLIFIEGFNMKEKFIKALESNDLDEMRKIPKSDLHNHAARGGNKRYIEDWTGVSISIPPKFNDFSDMNAWNSCSKFSKCNEMAM
jgi:hypothetical protein